jgi:hypothetical protein
METLKEKIEKIKSVKVGKLYTYPIGDLWIKKLSKRNDKPITALKFELKEGDSFEYNGVSYLVISELFQYKTSTRKIKGWGAKQYKLQKTNNTSSVLDFYTGSFRAIKELNDVINDDIIFESYNKKMAS